MKPSAAGNRYVAADSEQHIRAAKKAESRCVPLEIGPFDG
jgi:hypothetical protein